MRRQLKLDSYTSITTAFQNTIEIRPVAPHRVQGLHIEKGHNPSEICDQSHKSESESDSTYGRWEGRKPFAEKIIGFVGETWLGKVPAA